MRIFVGIDPGLNGGAVAVSVDQTLLPEQGGIGPQGSQGLQGLQGGQGLQDLQGIQGLQGLQDLQGIQGLQGGRGFEVVDTIATKAFSAVERAHTMSQWLIVYEPEKVLLEQVTVIQRQRGNDKLLASMGWWQGVLDAHAQPYELVRPTLWKRRAGIPPAPRGATDTQIKKLAVERAEQIFPGERFRGARGGVSGCDWKAEAALMALCGACSLKTW